MALKTFQTITKHNKHMREAAKYYNRVLVEACCNKDSLLSQQTPSSNDCLVIGITEDDDFASEYGKQLAKRFLIGKCCALWFSAPCTGGSPWQHINIHKGPKAAERIKNHWIVFRKLWKAFEEVATHAILYGCSVLVE